MANSSGRMKLYEGFYLWFSEYYSLYETTINSLMSEDNYMPVTWKYYLAIMAVSSIRCEYLLRELEMQFLLHGGDERWLEFGVNEIPEKLKKLERINNILAHQPWKLKIQDLTEIHSKNDSKGWHINELIHAVLILAYYHRLASIVEASRFTFKEYEETGSNTNVSDDLKDSKILKMFSEENVKKIIISELENINNTEKEKDVGNVNTTPKHSRKPSEELLKLNSSFENLLQNSCKDFSKHISTYCTVYLDFDSHSEEYESYIEFNWQDHGAYILKNFFPAGIDALDAEIEYITTISSNK
jgi:hypothetical protein